MTGTAARVGDVRVHGVGLDSRTRCAHYGSAVDVVALRFACCEEYYACHACHEATADHDPEVQPREAFDEPAVLCGRCGTELSVRDYLNCDDACPVCDGAFNPGCRRHRHRYFEE